MIINMTKKNKVKEFYFDGGVRGNKIAFVDRYNMAYKVKKMDNDYRGYYTSNQLEYLGLIKLLEYIKDKCFNKNIMIIGDSQLIINQVIGKYKINDEKLQEYKNEVDELLFGMGYTGVEIKQMFKWVPRDENLAGRLLEGKWP